MGDHVTGDPRDQADDREAVGGPRRDRRRAGRGRRDGQRIRHSARAYPPGEKVESDLIKRRLRAVPDAPGVYLMRDPRGQVIYVGKALRLRDRLRSYFTTAQPARTADLVK